MLKYYLTILLSAFACYGLNAQCPLGDVILTSQAEVDDFVATYPNCTEITGNMRIGSVTETTDIIDISGFSSLTSIGGDLGISHNAVLTSLTGLDELTSLGGNLGIGENAVLSSLAGLDQLTSISGNLIVNSNATLTSLAGLENLDATTIENLFITSNSQLSICAVESICDYVGVALNIAFISGNATGCATREEVETACLVSATAISPTNIKLFPNPTNGMLQLRNITAEEVVVYTAQGQLVALYDSPGQEVNLSALPAGVYHLRLITADAVYAARVVKQ